MYSQGTHCHPKTKHVIASTFAAIGDFCARELYSERTDKILMCASFTTVVDICFLTRQHHKVLRTINLMTLILGIIKVPVVTKRR
jgi:hypothetical protein